MPVPVYILITKCDLLSGFGEYFDELDDNGRAQVWGMTFPLETNGAAVRSGVRPQLRRSGSRLKAAS